MARTFGKTHVGIWADDDFLDLSPMAQWLFWHLFTHPELSYCGITDWRPRRIVPKAAGLTLDVIESAAVELAGGLYVVIDEDTEEVLVRSFMRSDELLKQTNMGAAVAKAHAAIASRTLRGVVVHELQRLRTENPSWKAWSALEDTIRKRPVNPSELTPWNPSGNPSPNPSGKGSRKGSENPSPNPSDEGPF